MSSQEVRIKRSIASLMRIMEYADNVLNHISEDLEPVTLVCDRPDRDVPGLKCGHPLPCPYHTVTIDTTAEPVATITIPATASVEDTLDALKGIAMSINGEVTE